MIKKRTLAIGGVIMLLLIACLIWLFISDGGEPAPQGQNQQIVTQFAYDDISQITVQNDAGEYTVLAQLPPAIEGERADQYNVRALEAFITVASNITSVNSIPMETTQLANFELEEPRATMQITLKDGSTHVLHLGMQNALDTNCYIRKDGSDMVFLVEDIVQNCMLMTKQSFRDMTLISGAGEDVVRELKEITILQGSGENQKRIVYEQLPFNEASTLVTYKMTAPIISNLYWETVQKKLLDKISELRGDGVLADTDDLASFGLDVPEYTLELVYEGGVERVFISSSPDDRYMVAVREDKPVVYLVEKSRVSFLTQEYTTMIGKSAYTRNVNTVKRMVVETKGQKLEVDVLDANNTLAPSIGGEFVDQNAFMTFYINATDIPLLREITPEDPTNGQVQLQMTLTLREGGQDVIELLELSNRQSMVRINGQLCFVTYTKIIEDMITNYNLIQK